MLDLNEIQWTNIQIPSMINTLLSFCSQKQYRQIIFEKILQFFSDLRNDPKNENNMYFKKLIIVTN